MSRAPIVGLVGALTLVACSSAEPPPTKGEVCETTRAVASHMMQAVADENGACKVDADCVVVPMNGSCFDACTTATNLVGKGAVDRQLTPVEAGPCKTFSNAGCTKITPPCAPPAAPVCNAGRCQ